MAKTTKKTEGGEAASPAEARRGRSAARPRPRRKPRDAQSAPDAAPSAATESAAGTDATARRPPRQRRPRRRDDPAVRAEKAAKLRERIAKLQRQLAELTADPTEPAAAPSHGAAPDVSPTGPVPSPEPSPATSWRETDAPRELLTSDYFMRQWGRLGVRRRSEELDLFGLDAKLERRVRPLLDVLFSSYFRGAVEGVHQVPGTGRCLLVANHSGGPVPYDGLLLRTALRREHPNRREVRWLTEDLFHHLPFVGVYMTRLGAVRACQENAQRLLHQGYAVAVFPEGVKGVGKLYRNRYRLQRFGRGGYIRLCIRTHTPLVPCAIVGAEEANPVLYRFEYMTRFLGVPYVPVTPTFPLLGPLGLVPAPTKVTVRFGEPLYFDGYAPEAADDEVLVGRLSDRVRATIQGMLDEIVAKRESVFFG